MANTSRTGFKPVRMLNGSPWNKKVGMYLIPSSDATAVFVGDVVKLAGDADSKTGVATVAQAAAGATTNIHVGVVVGVDPHLGVTAGSENFTRKHRPASTAMYVYVSDDPNTVYEVQEDAIGGALATADVGLNADIIVGSGDTVMGTSGMQLDTSTKATTATLPLKIIAIKDDPDNEKTNANQKVEVVINTHPLRAGVAGV